MAGPLRGRSWRRRGRRGQVAAIATLFGLMLVVTFIANFLTTVVPSQMAVNDLNHDVLVEDQVARLASLLQSVGSHGSAGVQVEQPVSLGSDGVAPWAAPDGSAVSAGATGSSLTLNFTTVTSAFEPPGGWRTTQGTVGSSCVTSPPPPNVTSISCVGASSSVVTYNFSGGSPSYSVSGTGGVSFRLNFSTSNSVIVVGGAGGGSEVIEVIGSYDSIFVSGTGGTAAAILIVGNWDNLTLNATASGANTITFPTLVVGNHDRVQVNSNKAAVLVTAWGTYDFVNANPTGSGSLYNVYFDGFDLQDPSSPICPYGNLSSTDNVSGGATGSTFRVTFNDTGRTGTTTYGFWSVFFQVPSSLACPYFLRVPFGDSGLRAGAFSLNLENTYAPRAVVAYDQGAVVQAQSGGVPLLLGPPPVSLTGGSATVWLPAFSGPTESVSGIGTAVLALRVLSVRTVVLPSNGVFLVPGSHVTMTIVTPFASAWMQYFSSHPSLAPYASCSGSAAACSGTWTSGGPLGTITLSVPASSLTLSSAVFSLAIQ